MLVLEIVLSEIFKPIIVQIDDTLEKSLEAINKINTEL